MPLEKTRNTRYIVGGQRKNTKSRFKPKKARAILCLQGQGGLEVVLKNGEAFDLQTLLPDLAPHLEEFEQRAIAESIGKVVQYEHLSEDEFVCREGEQGKCFWIVVEGMISVSFGDRSITLRGPGTIVGEQALLEKEGVRKATLKTVTPTKLCRIDRSAIFDSAEHKSAWLKIIAIGLSGKLFEATQRRKKLSDEISDSDILIRRFVCEYSLAKVRASINGFGDEYVRENALIWFSDLAGFSKCVSEFEPDIAAEIARRFMKIQADILSDYDAQIDKFMGDAVMAFWIAQESGLSTLADLAVTAAMETVNAVEQDAKSSGFDIGLRVGLHYGSVIIGNFGTDDRIAHTLIGPDVNLAARYEQAKTACDGLPLMPIRISPRIYDETSGNLRQRFSAQRLSEVKHGLKIPIHDGPLEQEEQGNALG